MNKHIKYSEKIKEEARNLRKQGLTHREIVKKLNASLGSISFWTKGIILDAVQKAAIEKRRNRISAYFNAEKRSDLARKNLAPFWKPKPSDQELLKRITDFYKNYKRIPLKKEFNNTYKEYKKRFGSWNEAVQLAGFSPNPEIYSKKFIANDGDQYDSFAEKIIDDWLSKNRLLHKRNFSYQDTKMTADFAVGENKIIEFFGLAGENKIYDQNIQRKREFCQKKGFKLIEIYPADLFSKNFKKCLGKILEEIRK